MVVDVQVAFAYDVDIETTVLRKLRKHVVKKTNTSVDFVRSCAVEIYKHFYACFFRFT
jgi:hypothetical protein